MANGETTEEPIGTDSIDVAITVVDNVRDIPQDKHSDRDTNYGAGVVAFKCIINGRCPLIGQPLVDNSLVFNADTVKGFSEGDFQNLSFVPGGSGIFLKEKYVYRSNFLFINNEEVTPQTDKQLSVRPAEYKQEQSWDVVKSVFDESDTRILTQEQYQEADTEEKANMARWDIVRETHHTDTNKEGDETKPNDDEAADSAIWAPSQMGSSPSTVGCELNLRGIHWKVVKKTPLFDGEDFFIEFRPIAIEEDFKNIESKPFVDTKYDFLDAVASLQGTTKEMPANSGVVAYDMKRNKDTGEPSGQWEKNKDSVKYFDFNRQSYYVIEIGVDEGKEPRYFVIISMKGSPIFVKVIKNKSYLLHSYNGVSGEQLITQKRLRMTFRNHLGNIIITFMGRESEPWVISERPVGENEPGVLRVPADKIAIWGGNIQTTFIFGPLEYVSEYELELPLSRRFVENPKNPVEAFKWKEPYQLPLIGASYNAALLSARDRGLDAGENDKNNSNTDSSNAQQGGESSDGSSYSFLEDRDSIWTNDVQYVEEAIVKISENQPGSPEQKAPDGETHFMNTGLYLKNYGASQEAIDDAEATISDKDRAKALDTAYETQGGKDMATCILLDMILQKDVRDVAQDAVDAAQAAYDAADVPGNEMRAAAAKTKLKDAQENLAGVSAGMDEKDAQRYMRFYLKCKLIAGHHIFKSSGLKLENCKTPVLTIIRLVCIPDQSNTAWAEEPVDASGHVLSFSDSWSSQDFHTMQHTGSITFLINKGLRIPNNQSEYLQSIQSKAFYIEIWSGYQGCNYSQLDGSYKLFTGICMGGIITEEAGKRTMQCQINDYSKICQETYIFNSPFFDGMRDLNAIYELAEMIGFRSDEGSPSAPDPAYLIRMAAQTETNDNLTCPTPDGRGYETKPYALPSSYARLTQPFFRFADGTNYWDIMQQITQKAGKVVFFDTYGMLHYEYLPFTKFLFGNMSPNDIEPLWKFTALPTGDGQQVFNTLTFERAVGDMFNSINVMTSTPDYEMIINSDVNWESITNPNSPGFLGYKKIFFQQDGIFGSLKTTQDLINHYSIFYRAPIVYKFETYGQPLRCFDIVEYDGQKLIVMNVSSEINKQENKWWQNIECEWYHGETAASEIPEA